MQKTVVPRAIKPAYLLKVSRDIRLLIYDLVLIHQKQTSVPRERAWRDRHTNERSALAIRLVSRQIAGETFGYLFHTLNISQILNGHQTSFAVAKLQSVMEGRWNNIVRLQASWESIVGCGDSEFFDNLLPEAFDEMEANEKVDATNILPLWEIIGWPLENRKIRTITLRELSEVVKFKAIPDFLLYLGLFKVYFPLLTEVRLMCQTAKYPSDRVQYTERYKIVGRELRVWETDKCKWTIPEITFAESRTQQAEQASDRR